MGGESGRVGDWGSGRARERKSGVDGEQGIGRAGVGERERGEEIESSGVGKTQRLRDLGNEVLIAIRTPSYHTIDSLLRQVMHRLT